MKTRTIGFSFALALLGASSGFALEACSSSDDSGTGTPDVDSGAHDTGASTTRPDTSTGTGDTGTTTGDTGTAPGDDSSAPGDDSSVPTGDAADIPDGGIPVTPGKVICGGATCDLSANTCCAFPDGGGTCSASTCPSGTAKIKCSEKADCTGTDVCCGTLNPSGSADTTCGQGPCAPEPLTVQFCRTNSECENSKPCVVQVCEGVTLELCGLSQFCQAK